MREKGKKRSEKEASEREREREKEWDDGMTPIKKSLSMKLNIQHKKEETMKMLISKVILCINSSLIMNK